jgi:hypoxanthine phosphoribosyltransferase
MTNKIYYSWGDIEGAVNNIASQIYKSNWRPDYIIGITRGGLVPATMLSHILGVKMHTLDVRLRDGDDVGPETNCWMADDAYGYNLDQPKNILIIDDINDSGATFNWIIDNWQSSCLPNDNHWNNIWHQSVRFAVLTNNLSSQLGVDYYAYEVNKAEKDCWLVYPWENWYKNKD